MDKNILKGKDWKQYLELHGMKKREYLALYSCTYKHVQIYKIEGYFFTLGIYKGYKNLSSLKRNIR